MGGRCEVRDGDKADGLDVRCWGGVPPDKRLTTTAEVGIELR